jgi:lysine-N-methylase
MRNIIKKGMITMEIYFPSYYKNFKCIASKCQGSCCSAGWQIFIDTKTAEHYKSIDGTFGKKLQDNIDFSDLPQFKLKPNGRCPFLDENNLCEIYSTLGPEHLCETCAEHPRFYECFNTRIECGLGIYCEEACRIILSQTDKFRLYSENTSEEFSLNYDNKIFDYLFKCRTQVFDYLDDNQSPLPINSRIRDCLWFAHTIQQDIDSQMLDEEEIFSVSPTCQTDIEYFLKYLLTLDQNDKNWFGYLNSCITTYNNYKSKLKEFYEQTPERNKYIKNLAIYFVYRYFLRATFDEDVLSIFKFIAISLKIIDTLFFCNWIQKGTLDLKDCIMIAKKYSEEIECSDDNLEAFLTSCYDDINFSTEAILALL